MRYAAIIAMLMLGGLHPSQAEACRLTVAGSKCVVAGPAAPEYQSRINRMRDAVQRGAPLPPGTILPRNKGNILLLADYYGLPGVQDGWVYVAVERQVYRVDFRTYRVLELVTDQTAANW